MPAILKVGIHTFVHYTILKIIVFVPQRQKYNKEGRSDKGGNDCAIFNVYCNIWENQVEVGGIIDESTITALGDGLWTAILKIRNQMS